MTERVEEIRRCLVTGNPCGTDTRPVGRPCECMPCLLTALAQAEQSIMTLTEDREKWFNRCEFELEPRLAQAERDREELRIRLESKIVDRIKANVKNVRLSADLARVRAALDIAQDSLRWISQHSHGEVAGEAMNARARLLAALEGR